MTKQEKIKHAEKRIKELTQLIKLWKTQQTNNN